METIGFVKDAIASVMFLVSIPVVQTAPMSVITAALAMGATVDALFTLNPEWHCQRWDTRSAPVAVILCQVLGFLYLVSRCT